MTSTQIFRLGLGLGAFTLGCSGSGSTGFKAAGAGGPSPGGDGSSSDDASAFSGSDDAAAFLPMGDGGVFFQGTADGGESVQGVCVAGVYTGKFTTTVGSGSGGPFAIMWNGNLSIDLAARKVTIVSGGGEGLSTETSQLEIAEGGVLEGGDTMGGTFFADLNGDLDCAPDAGPPYRLTATLSQGIYQSAFFSVPMGGDLSADYQASKPPMLVNGAIHFYGTGDAGGGLSTMANGTWSATWVSP
jgi:hypothetical protein